MSMHNNIKHWWRDLFRYPAYQKPDASYDAYWEHRDMGALNSFQKERADFLLTKVHDGDSVLDVGCGDGRILAYLQAKNPTLHLSGVDGSPMALRIARERGLAVREGDIRDLASLGDAAVDHIVFFEVLEHIADSEALLAWAVAHASKAVVFSVPNTGFFTHRFRLLLGRFPLQWRAHPSEHVRFWTVQDMHWWLDQLGYRYELHTYEGVPFLNRLWPSLFAAGMIISIKS